MTSGAIQRRWARWALGLAFWTLIGLFFAGLFYHSSLRVGRPVSWTQAVGSALADWYVWALLSLPIVQVARRFRFDSAVWVRNVGVHLVASALFSLVYILLRALVGQLQSRLTGGVEGFSELVGVLLPKTFQLDLLIYWVMVSVSHAFDYYREYQERALRATDLEKRLAQARLQALRMQLNPHFLFNTLNSISSLMHQDVAAADRMVARLADLLRYALDSTDAHEVPLRKELAFLERYLEIERTRFGARLTVRMEVDPAVVDALVPNLVLQPLVENAIKHGIEKRSKPGLVTLRAAMEGDELVLQVQDNGPGLPPDGERRAERRGIGVANTRARLEQMYGPAQTLQLRNRPEGGVVAEARMPFRRADGLAEARAPA